MRLLTLTIVTAVLASTLGVAAAAPVDGSGYVPSQEDDSADDDQSGNMTTTTSTPQPTTSGNPPLTPDPPETTTVPDPDTERVDSDTRLVDATYNPSDGTARITLRTDGPTAITLTDAAGFIEGGEVERRSVVVDGEETIVIPVTRVDGYVAVGISTDETLYAVPIETRSRLFRGTAQWGYVWLAGLLGVVGGSGTVLYYAREFLREDDPEIAERVL